MTDDSENKRETLTVNRPNKLSLTKTVESGKVKQNFTHGRSKTVTVEVRKTRSFARGAAGMVEVQGKAPNRPQPAELNLSHAAINLHDMQVRDKTQIDAASREVRSGADDERRRVAGEARAAANAPAQRDSGDAPPVRGRTTTPELPAHHRWPQDQGNRHRGEDRRRR